MKEKNYSLRSKVYKVMGTGVIFVSTLGGFLLYEAMMDWNNFKEETENFTLIYEDTTKLNLTVALPMLMGLLVFMFVMLKKNKEFFKDKISLNLLIVLTFMYLFYSVIELTMFALMGAFVGSVIDEFGFSPLAKSAKMKADENKDIDLEKRREKMRITARKQAREDFDGSV